MYRNEKNSLYIFCWELDVWPTCTRQDISFVVEMLGRYQSNPSLDHWKIIKKVLRYLHGMKDHMLTYRRFNHLEVI